MRAWLARTSRWEKEKVGLLILPLDRNKKLKSSVRRDGIECDPLLPRDEQVVLVSDASSVTGVVSKNGDGDEAIQQVERSIDHNI